MSILIKDTTREERERVVMESIGNVNGFSLCLSEQQSSKKPAQPVSQGIAGSNHYAGTCISKVIVL